MFNNVYNGKKVLITGHTGFKGSWLSLWLNKLGAKVYGYSIDIPTSPSHYEESSLSTMMEHNECDVTDYGSLKRVIDEIQPDFVFHLAAQAIVRACYDNPRLAFETNLMGTINVLESIRGSSVKSAVLITSDKCYENVEWEYGYREGDLLGGKDPYSASKACAEIAFSSYVRSFFDDVNAPRISTARAGNVIGGGDWAKDRIIPDCVRSWAKDEVVEIRSPNATRPWQLVLEPLSGYLQLGADLYLGKPGLHGEAFNFGPREDDNMPVVDLIKELTEVWDNGRYKINNPDPSKDEAGLLKLCCDKALFRMKWKAVLHTKETIRMTGEWYRNYYLDKTCSVREFSLNQIEEYESLARERSHSWASMK